MTYVGKGTHQADQAAVLLLGFLVGIFQVLNSVLERGDDVVFGIATRKKFGICAITGNKLSFGDFD